MIMGWLWRRADTKTTDCLREKARAYDEALGIANSLGFDTVSAALKYAYECHRQAKLYRLNMDMFKREIGQ